jgi:NADH-quinone oxidoreductase subunit H
MSQWLPQWFNDLVPSWVTPQLVTSALTIILVVHIILVSCALLVYFERKISAYIQDRIGPNRVGFDLIPALGFLKGCLGLGQSLADGIKFMLKEDYTPNRVDKILFTLAPIIIVVPALMGFVIIPWGGQWDGSFFGYQLFDRASGLVHVAGAHVNVGIVYLLAVASLGVYGVTLGGWASNNKYSFLGALRASAQMISYEIPLGLALLTALLVIGSVQPHAIIRSQVENGWLLWSQPLAALVFYITIMAEGNRAPFDNAECEQELVGGYHTEYSSMRFALFFLAEYAHLVTSSAFFVMLFMGGYSLKFAGWVPEISLLSPDNVTFLAVLAKFAVFFGKCVLSVCFMMLVRWTIPRLRYDQIMVMGWNMLIPIMLIHVVAVSTMVYWNKTDTLSMFLLNVGMIAFILIAAPLLPKNPANKKIPIYGSRFSPMPGERVRTQSALSLAHEDRPAESLV